MKSPKLVVIETIPRRLGGAGTGMVDSADAAAISRLNHYAVNVVLLVAGPPFDGHADIADFNRCHAAMHRAFAEAGAQIDALLFCPHGAGQSCDCRLPSPRLLTGACDRFCIENDRAAVIARSHPVGEAARRADLRILWITGDGSGPAGLVSVGSLGAAVDQLVADMHADSP